MCTKINIMASCGKHATSDYRMELCSKFKSLRNTDKDCGKLNNKYEIGTWQCPCGHKPHRHCTVQ